MRTIKRKDAVAWLLRNGFVERGKSSSGHRYFTHVTGVKIAVPGHGPADLDKHVAGNIVGALARLGFDREQVRLEMSGAA